MLNVLNSWHLMLLGWAPIDYQIFSLDFFKVRAFSILRHCCHSKSVGRGYGSKSLVSDNPNFLPRANKQTGGACDVTR